MESPALTSLVLSVEVVQERVARDDRALVDEGGAISPVGVLLEHAVPVLHNRVLATSTSKQTDEGTYDGGLGKHGCVGEVVDDVDLEVIALRCEH